MTLKRVVFPAPLGPITPTISPRLGGQRDPIQGQHTTEGDGQPVNDQRNALVRFPGGVSRVNPTEPCSLRHGPRRTQLLDAAKATTQDNVTLPKHGVMCTTLLSVRTDTASRVITAPLDRVYAAFIDQEALEAWLLRRG